MSFGAVLAGGRNVRFGAHKALAAVGGVRIIDRVEQALRAAVDNVVLIANEPDSYATVRLPIRGDARPGLGPLGGIHAALRWARDAGEAGALCVACDMPFVEPGLLRAILIRAAGPTAPDIVAPESGGRRGVEPLCAWYSTRCIAPIEASAGAGDLRVIGFWEALRVEPLPIDRVRAHGDPATLFMNVNTPEEHAAAERIAAEASRG